MEAVSSALDLKWEFSQQSQGVAGQWWNGTLDDSAWAKTTQGNLKSPLNWYRMKFELPVAPAGEWIPWKLNLEAAGNGFVYLNGHRLGRWWEVGPQHDFFLPECWLQFGTDHLNIVTIEMRLNGRRKSNQEGISRAVPRHG